MHNSGHFDLPRRPNQSTKGARRAYAEAFDGDVWPGTDAELRAMTLEVDAALETSPTRTPKTNFLLMLMRERSGS